MAVEQLMNYYPKYEDLDYAISTSGKNKLNLYIDFKGCAQSIYQEWAIRHIVTQSRGCRQADCSLFYSLLHFISWHKMYAKKRKLELKIYIFLESGDSAYHINVLKSYKENRHNSNIFNLDMATKELYTNVLRKNYQVIDKIVNKIPECFVIYLWYMEADFIPWYIIHHAKKELNDDCNIIYTMDKDMLQCLKYDNIFQYYRHYQKKIMLSKHNALNHFLKNDEIDSDKYIEFFPMLLAILGDSADEFPGIRGIGEKRLCDMLPQLAESINFSMDHVYDCISKNISIFHNNKGTNNKYMEMVYNQEELIIKNLRLLSFELLSRYVNDDYRTEVIEKKNKILSIVNESQNNKIKKWNVLYYALNNMSMESINISENVIQNLF